MKKEQSTEHLRQQNKRTIIFATAVLLCAVLLGSAGFLLQSKGTAVIVEVNGVITNRFLLQDEIDYVITGANGGKNRLIITNGEAYILSADCPNYNCVHSAPITRVGQSIVCLPNKVHVYIEGETDKEAFDAITN